jgi:hypothetical protein
MGDKLLQHLMNIKRQELDKNVNDTYKTLQQVYGDRTMSTKQTLCGLNNFKIKIKRSRH